MGKQNEHPLRLERLRRGWTQQQLADHAQVSFNTVARAEQGKALRVDICRLLCDCLGKEKPEDLGLHCYGLPDEEPDPRGEASLLDDVSVLATSQERDKELDRLMTRRVARLQHWVVDGLEDGTHLRWQLYYTSRNSLTEDGLLNQIARLEQFADDGGEQHQRVCRILAQNYQLAGSLARDGFHYTKALRFFQKAEQLHEETQLVDLTATAIARQAIALLRKDPEKYLKESLALYSRAAAIATHAEPYTQAYVLSRYAEALARAGNDDDCLKYLDQAEILLSRTTNIPIEEDVAYIRLTFQSLADSRGECFVLLGKPQQGLEHLQAAQKRLPQKMSRNTCRLLMQQSEAYLAAGAPDACVQYAIKGLEIAHTLESTSNIHWASEILAKLRSSSFCNEPVVETLSEAIRG